MFEAEWTENDKLILPESILLVLLLLLSLNVVVDDDDYLKDGQINRLTDFPVLQKLLSNNFSDVAEKSESHWFGSHSQHGSSVTGHRNPKSHTK